MHCSSSRSVALERSPTARERSAYDCAKRSFTPIIYSLCRFLKSDTVVKVDASLEPRLSRRLSRRFHPHYLVARTGVT